MSKESLLRAVELADGQVAMARAIKARMPACKVKQSHVWQWLNTVKGETPPAEYVIAIAAAVGYQVTPHQLRADIYPNPSDGMPPGALVERRDGDDRRKDDRRAA